MVSFPNCKINIGLQIKDKRPDGFHNLETVFVPVPLHDALEVVRSENDVSLNVTGMAIDAAAEDNICVKAYRLLKEQFPQLPPVQMHLHKVIPSGAGLGGGSADGAFTLKLLNDKFGLGISQQELISFALQLGSDCPFFIYNKPCYATGRGEKMEPLALDLSPYSIYLVNPKIHVSTGWAFGQLKPHRKHEDLKQVISEPIETWKGRIINDFEAPVFGAYPEIENIKKALYEACALFAGMTGSGSTVFAFFPKGHNIELGFPDQYITVTADLQDF